MTASRRPLPISAKPSRPSAGKDGRSGGLASNPKPIGLSFAQNYEDVLLWRALGHVQEGRYLDIGACDPTADSVSKAFYLAGWRGVHVDASATYAAALRNDRPDETVIQAAVGDQPGTITFYEFPETGLSTCVAEYAERHRAAGHACNVTTVPTIALSDLLDLAAGPELHWLKIDVEGLEGSVLRSWGDSPVRPWVLVIESTEPNSQVPAHQEWLGIVLALGYHEVAFDGLSRFFVSNAHPQLDAAFVAGPNIFDDFNVTDRHFSSRVLVGQWHAERDQLQADLATLEARAAAQEAAGQQALAEAQAAAAAEQAVVRQLEGELQRAGEAARHLAEQNQAVAASRDNLQRALQVRAVETARLTASIDAVSQERDRLVNEVAALHALLTAQMADHAAQRHELNLKIAQAEGRAVEAAGQLAAEQQELTATQSRLAQATVSEQQLQAQLGHITGLLATLQEERAAEQRASTAAIAALRDEVTLRNHRLAEGGRIMADAASLLASNLILAVLPGRRRELRSIQRKLASWGLTHPDHPQTNPTSEPGATGTPPPQESRMSIFTLDTRDPYHRANSLAELCEFADLDFVRCAYVTILGRQPDPEGEAYYAVRLREGVSKLSILRQLRHSHEGRSHDPGIAGLDRVLRQHRNANLPVAGRLIRWLTRREGDGPIERRLRAIENRHAVAASQATWRFLHINHLLHELDGSLAGVRREVQQIRAGSGGAGPGAARQLASTGGDWSAALSASLKS